MEIGEIVAVASVLVTIFLATIVLVWQMRTQGNRLSDEIREQGVRISEQGVRISDVEREQARMEGANGTLSQILRQQSHTHEAGD